ncbi:TetR/AcrR family transcriptional regulator [Arthrobacter sp. RIT-PI-e]|uniref:TetR/AcrR family transcriptional regulator n=1 Tax=Arthrobacter sp. RIT-PI-e TaxID=1681197 RepID=UPI0009E653FA|nr:TetR/AcrR family transcriptional regulator [Arthrobacter sp. RIT-PI-e]
MTDRTAAPPGSTGCDAAAPADPVRSGRDAVRTRGALVRAARRRFATDGYRATTVRRIASDVGVNVALIGRYFGSKEGLFEACMNRTAEELGTGGPARSSAAEGIDGTIGRLIAHVVEAPNADDPLQLLLLLRSSGDENADAIRRRTLQTFTERLAASAGWDAADPATAGLLLRAQIAIATMLGLVMLRTSVGAQPAASATIGDLEEPLGDLLRGLLAPDS